MRHEGNVSALVTMPAPPPGRQPCHQQRQRQARSLIAAGVLRIALLLIKPVPIILAECRKTSSHSSARFAKSVIGT